MKSFVGLTLKKGEVRSGTRAGLTEPSWGIASGNPCPEVVISKVGPAGLDGNLPMENLPLKSLPKYYDAGVSSIPLSIPSSTPLRIPGTIDYPSGTGAGDKFQKKKVMVEGRQTPSASSSSSSPRPGLSSMESFGNLGQAAATFWDGKASRLIDGFGLCSPGRWPPARRGLGLTAAQGKFIESLDEVVGSFCRKTFPDPQRLVLAMALGKVKAQPFTESQLSGLRAEWFGLLPDPVEAARVPPHQPFFLYAISRTLEAMGDPDWQVLAFQSGWNYADGVPVGLDMEMPRTPEVFPEKTHWRHYDISTWEPEMSNYPSAVAAAGQLEAQFKEEELEGMMFPLSLNVARQRYPGDRPRIAAQGALEKPDGSVRSLHDGTHGVLVNPGIRPRDQLQNPGPADSATTMQLAQEQCPGVHITLAADIRKAHRRVKHREEDWGLLACRAHPDSDTIWINRVGCFGIGCAAYWWGRLAAACGRLALRLAQRDYVWAMIFADDLRVTAGGPHKYMVILEFYVTWIMIGAPFSWHKFRRARSRLGRLLARLRSLRSGAQRVSDWLARRHHYRVQP